MTEIPEEFRDLLDIQCGSLTTIGADGIPRTTIVYFLYEDGQLRTSLERSRKKVHNLVERPQCSMLLSVDPMRYLDVRGLARVEPDTDYEFARRLLAKYGLDPEGFGMIGQDRVVVSIDAKQVYSADLTAHSG